MALWCHHAGAGIKMPEKLDGKGIFSLALQVLGITEDNIFNQIEKKIGADKADKVRTAWDAIKAVMKDGIEAFGSSPKSNSRTSMKW